MAANNDNAMARFLFAILRQKCLKDIDWNKVASDPVLLQPITNGHAARMRYSRFRSSMLGIEPQRRNRTAGNSRVTKNKKDKDSKGAKDDKASKVKRDEDTEEVPEQEHSGLSSARSSISTRGGKPETKPLVLEGQVTASPTMSTLGIFPGDGRVQFQNRLMTPCSDSDVIMAPQGYAGSPISDILHQEAFDFPAPGHCGSNDHAGAWQHHSPTYPTFGMGYDLDGYSSGFGEHSSPHHQHSHHHEQQSQGLCVPSAIMDPDPGHASVKQETWDSQYHVV